MSSHPARIGPALAIAVLVGFGAGCRTVHEVKIDAISDAGKPLGQLCRLELRPGPTADEPLLRRVAAHVEHALALNGIGIAPVGTKPDVVIQVEAGVGPAQRKFVYEATVEPQYRVGRKDRKMIQVHEKYLRVSAREPHPAGHAPGPEIWSVNVGVEDESPALAPYLPALTAALIDHIGDHASEEKVVRIPENHAKRAVGMVPGT
ncbi:MAG TPA: hypothetical protein VEB66_11560 [Opitutaceae bacterium]|nr:hypothetical protein [Opitutaceae bacterium]